MLKLIQNNDIKKVYFKDWIGAVDYLSEMYEDKINEQIALGSEQFNKFFISFCESHIEIDETNPRKSRYTIRIKN